MKKLLILIFAVTLFSCKEDITPIVPPNPPEEPGEDPGEDPGEEEPTDKYANCIPVLTDNNFDIVTWNIEQFAKADGSTIALLTEIIPTLNADIIALQEISSTNEFTTLLNALPGWQGVLSGGSLRTGYLYKTSEVSVSAVTYPFPDDTDHRSAFPRPPMFITATHTSGMVVTLINLHLKCCDDGNSIDRRRSASNKLKAYIDTNLSTQRVVVLGDYNEDITQPEGNNVFTNFVNDDTNYLFADMEIAQSNQTNWSYPSWPSHLDHILITNELFENVVDTRTLKLNQCEGSYYNIVSDHRPVLMTLEP